MARPIHSGAVDMPPENGPTRVHEMYSLFADTPAPTAFFRCSASWMERKRARR